MIGDEDDEDGDLKIIPLAVTRAGNFQYVSVRVAYFQCRIDGPRNRDKKNSKRPGVAQHESLKKIKRKVVQ